MAEKTVKELEELIENSRKELVRLKLKNTISDFRKGKSQEYENSLGWDLNLLVRMLKEAGFHTGEDYTVEYGYEDMHVYMKIDNKLFDFGDNTEIEDFDEVLYYADAEKYSNLKPINLEKIGVYAEKIENIDEPIIPEEASMFEQKEQELAALEAEEKTISEAEALIEKQTEKQEINKGNGIGE